METNRWKATIALSSDHAAINAELDKFERAMLWTLARIGDARHARDYVRKLRWHSAAIADAMGIDQRSWIERTRKARA
jgi:hypothetical protein